MEGGGSVRRWNALKAAQERLSRSRAHSREQSRRKKMEFASSLL